MKIAILCNFTYPSIGGSEQVCRHIAESMANRYNDDVSTFGYNVKKDFVYNQVKYHRCNRGLSLIRQLMELDHIFIYSDSFWGLETIIDNIGYFKKTTFSLVALGLYAMQKNPSLLSKFRCVQDRFTLIVHFSYCNDFGLLLSLGMDVTIIPNGVKIAEFYNNASAGYDSYLHDYKDLKIDGFLTNNVIINISNYFHGKGQHLLPDIAHQLRKIRKKEDFVIWQCSSTSDYPFSKQLLQSCIDRCNRQKVTNVKFFVDLPGPVLISMLKMAKCSVLTSESEIFPLVILESMACAVPWISRNVGNVSELRGGVVLETSEINTIALSIHNVLDNDKERERLSHEGFHQVITQYNWDNIQEQYYNIFHRGEYK